MFFNLPRPTRDHEEIEQIITNLPDSVKSNDDPLQVLSDCVRSCIVASEGKKLIVADLAGIEARVLAWLAGETWKINAFENGEDLYVTTYAHTFNIEPHHVTKAQRAIGKVMELALGYQGGAKAFQRMASTTGMDLRAFATLVRTNASLEDWEHAEGFCQWMQDNRPDNSIKDLFVGTACELVKSAWRNKHEGVTTLWRRLQDAFDITIKNGNPLIPHIFS